jgi:hypothetical protein
MKVKITGLLFAIMLLTQLSCTKDDATENCPQLKAAIVADDTATVSLLVTDYINGLSSKFYTEASLNALAAAIASQCTITARVLCFDCVQTLPSQTEIEVTFSNNGSTVKKIFDISYRLQTNIIVFSSMHN